MWKNTNEMHQKKCNNNNKTEHSIRFENFVQNKSDQQMTADLVDGINLDFKAGFCPATNFIVITNVIL